MREIAAMVHPARDPRRRYLLLFKMYCDESHDSPKQKRTEFKSFVVGGFISDPDSWERIEKHWNKKNKIEGIARYHASHLNAASYEYEGWSTGRRKRYSKEILKILKNRGNHVHGMSCGMHVDSYRKVISADGQKKMGSPYIVCFKTLVATVAKQLDEGGFRPDDQFAVIVDRGDWDIDAVRVFYGMKDDANFRHRHRLATCTPGDAESFIGLQPADFVAYETFRLMHDKREGPREIRAALRGMLGTTGFFGYLLDEEVFLRIRADVDAAQCIPDGLFIVPPNLDER